MFIGATDGWLNPLDSSATAEDIAVHLAEIDDLGSFTAPDTMLDEINDVRRKLEALAATA